VVIVRVNDRLPKKSKRMVDVTLRAAKQLNFVKNGLAKVKIEILKDSLP
jgi:rare lipoprotein A